MFFDAVIVVDRVAALDTASGQMDPVAELLLASVLGRSPQDSERDLADTGGLFKAGDEERQSFMMHAKR